MSWQRWEVAIPIPNPGPFERDGTVAGGREGARRYWKWYHNESRLLILRASIPLRANTPDPELTAGTIARDWWNSRGHFAIGIMQLAGVDKLAGWCWREDDGGPG